MKKFILILGVALGATSCTTYRNYYRSSSKLIEEMIDNDDAFFDTIGEGDSYDDYMRAKSKVSKIIKNKTK